MTALFISDLHLKNDLSAFRIFCEQYAPQYEHIFILGDLFDMYLGDDLIDEHYSEIVTLLHTLSTHSQVYIMYGNRDFLMGDEFYRRTKTTLITEPYIFNNVVLMHGDSLVRDDWKYRIFKLLLRNCLSTFLLKRLPKKIRTRFAHSLKEKTNQSKHSKPLEIMDVNETYADKIMKCYKGKDLIHGHTHRPNVHHREDYARYVLPSWEITAHSMSHDNDNDNTNVSGGFELTNGQITAVTFAKQSSCNPPKINAQ